MNRILRIRAPAAKPAIPSTPQRFFSELCAIEVSTSRITHLGIASRAAAAYAAIHGNPGGRHCVRWGGRKAFALAQIMGRQGSLAPEYANLPAELKAEIAKRD